MLAQHAEMEQDVAVELVADEEAEAARRVEPFHPAGDRRQLGRGSDSSESISIRASPVGQLALVRVHDAPINMRASVGKPTLVSADRKRSAQLGRVDLGSGRQAPTIARASAKPWPGADHRGERLLALLADRVRGAGERPEPPALGEAQRGRDRFVIGMVARGLAVGFLDARPSRSFSTSRRLP